MYGHYAPALSLTPSRAPASIEQQLILQIAERIRHRVDAYTAAFPSLLEIPSKDHPYDPDKDSVLKRVRRLFGE